MSGPKIQTFRVIRAMLWLAALLVGQHLALPPAIGLPHAAAQILADPGAHVPVVQSKSAAIAIRLEARSDPPEKADLAPTQPATSVVFVSADGTLTAHRAGAALAVALAKGFWACAPPHAAA